MTYLSEQIADGALAAWLLAGAAGSSTMADSSGNARNGTHTNVDLGATPGLIEANTCARYNGVDSFSSVASASWMNVSNITVESVFRPSVNNAVQQLFSRESATSANRSFQFRINASGKLEFIFFDTTGTARTVSGLTTLSRFTTYYGAATYDGTTARLFVGATQDNTLSLSGTLRSSPGAPIEVGRINTSGGTSTWFSGTQAGLGIYGTALSATRIAAHAAAAVPSASNVWDGSGTWGLVS